MADQQYLTSVSNFQQKYPAIVRPGKFQLKVRSVSTNPVYNLNLKRDEYIVNFYACFPTRWSEEVTNMVSQAIETNSDIDVAKIPSVSFNVPASGYIPTKGEVVNVIVENVFSKRNDKNVVAITSVGALPVSTLENSWSFMKAKTEETPVNQSTPAIEAPADVVTVDAESGDDLPF